MQHFLKIENLARRFPSEGGDLTVFENVNFEIEKGEFKMSANPEYKTEELVEYLERLYDKLEAINKLPDGKSRQEAIAYAQKAIDSVEDELWRIWRREGHEY